MTTGDGQIGALMELTGLLTEVMAREVELLRTMRSSDIATLGEEKAKLAAAYAGMFETVRANPALVKDAEPGLRETLKEATAALKAEIEDNVRAITAAKTLNERLIRALSAAFAEALSPIAAYTSKGETRAPTPALGQMSLSVDNRI